MNQGDISFIETLGLELSPSSLEVSHWKIFPRNGSILMILPDQKIAFRQGLDLYSPQRKLAQALVQTLKSIPSLRRFLKSLSVGLVSGGPVDCLLRETGFRLLGVLLGNPKQKERRALLLLEDEMGRKSVAKLGTTLDGVRKVACEISLLEGLNSEEADFFGVPPLRGNWGGETWRAFALDFFEVTPGSSLTQLEVVEVLEKWAAEERSSNFLRTSSWEGIAGQLTAAESEISLRLELRSSLRHGDFAPWNILRTADGDPMVIDWEFGLENDVPAWDLVHYLLLEADLVERREPADSLERTVGILKREDRMQEFLKFTGWVGQEQLLVKSYLFSMGDQLPQFAPFLDSAILLSPASPK